MHHTLICCDCLDYLRFNRKRWDTVFADPPDNIGKQYESDGDSLPDAVYADKLNTWLRVFACHAETVWFSYNARWGFVIGRIVEDMLRDFEWLEARNCVQTFTFGQHNHHDLCNNHRPLLRLRHTDEDAPLFTDRIRVQSWRQKHGDKRADSRGKVPGDVFDFPRVTGNSKQRRKWHPTQLHEGLVERCLKLTTPRGGSVLDPFAGTGTTLRVGKRLDFECTLIEREEEYCREIAREHGISGGLARDGYPTWTKIHHVRCGECNEKLITTPGGFLTCPKGHGKLRAG